jgi:cell division protein ZapA (FtsZ GTPase activity inhibitor)
MSEDQQSAKITIDGTEYSLDKLSEAAKAQLANIQFVDVQIQQLNNEWAVADTARIGYMRALKAELAKSSD